MVPGQRFRFEQHAQLLRRQGIRLDVSSFLPLSVMPILHKPGRHLAKAQAVWRGMATRVRDLTATRRYDAVLVFREATPLGPPWVERVLKSVSVPYLFDFDDAIYLDNASAANPVAARLKFARKTATIVRHASLVVAGNQHLAAWASQYARNVTVIPTTIDATAYVPRRNPSNRARPLCIGWSGSVTTSPYLDALGPVLRDLQLNYGVRLRVIGDPGYKVPGAVVEALPWQAETEVSDLQEIDIGLMPLADDEWARGKCGLKALQYMALGIPTVMSPVGVNRDIADGDAALLATTPDEWHRVLSDLIADPTKRELIGRKGRARVEKDYSTEAVAPRWADALRRVAAFRTA